MTDLTWTCHVCGDERQDAFISVHTVDLSAKFSLPLGYIRYCNDRPKCKEGAPSRSQK